MRLRLANCQRPDPVPVAWLRSRARRALRLPGLRGQGTIVVSFIDDAAMRALHGRFMGDPQATDVLSFHYGDRARAASEIMGEILIAPAAARRYAAAHGVPYREELARYVMHGLLHWLGHDDRTAAQQRRMRALEDQLLSVR